MDSLAGRMAGEADRRSLAAAVAVRTDAAILEELRSALLEPMSESEWDRLVLAGDLEARRQLVAEHGNPDPHRLA